MKKITEQDYKNTFTQMKNQSDNDCVIHAAHTYYGLNTKKVLPVNIMIMISSALFFKVFNPKSTIDFYGDKKTAAYISKINDKLNLYDNINDNLLDESVKNSSIDTKVFFSFSKFYAIKDLLEKYKGKICIIDTDLITFKNLAKEINNHSIFCTHFEKTDDANFYPNPKEINHNKNYRIPDDAYEYTGYACNTSILGLSDKNIISEYINEVFDFMNSNFNSTQKDLLWIEQVMLSIIAKRHSIKIHPFIDAIFDPKTCSFNPQTWWFNHLYSLSEFKYKYRTFHTWFAKSQFTYAPKFANYTCLILLVYIKNIISEDKAMEILELPEFKDLKYNFVKLPTKFITFLYNKSHLATTAKSYLYHKNKYFKKHINKKYNLIESGN